MLREYASSLRDLQENDIDNDLEELSLALGSAVELSLIHI